MRKAFQHSSTKHDVGKDADNLFPSKSCDLGERTANIVLDIDLGSGYWHTTGIPSVYRFFAVWPSRAILVRWASPASLKARGRLWRFCAFWLRSATRICGPFFLR
jgi:hypothetical protein